MKGFYIGDDGVIITAPVAQGAVAHSRGGAVWLIRQSVFVYEILVDLIYFDQVLRAPSKKLSFNEAPCIPYPGAQDKNLPSLIPVQS